MKIVSTFIRKVDIPLKTPFETSFTRMTSKKCIILELHDQDGTVGYGESSAFDQPFYNEEFRDGSWELITKQLLPRIMNKELTHPDDLYDLVIDIRRNNMSKAAINCALWDIYAKQHHQTLAQALGGNRDKVETGVSIGVQNSPEQLVKVVEGYLRDGYRRIKMKIKPGKDYEYIAAVREKFPDTMLMADANSAYRLTDVEMLKKLDALNLIMIEQPLEPGDLVDHATLQAQLKTSICLDESVTSLDDARKMVQLKSGRIINIKFARVGGLTIAKQIQTYAQENDIECWCGGMLDSGIARAGNIAIATLSGYTLPNDIAASKRYYADDIIEPTIALDGTFVDVSAKEGLGYDINRENLDRFTIKSARV